MRFILNHLLGFYLLGPIASQLVSSQNILNHGFSRRQSTASSNAGPNVLFIMSDDQDLRMGSMDVVPNVHRLMAEEGTTYNKHFCTNALCCPSRASVLTGKAVHNINVTDVAGQYGGYSKFVKENLNNDYLPIWLQDAGVNTYYVGKFLNEQGVKNHYKPHAKGWTNSNFLLQPGTYDYLNTIWSYNKKEPQAFPNQNAINVIMKHSLEILDEAVQGNKPFFLAVSPAIPHVGISSNGSGTFVPVPLEKYADAFSGKSVPNTRNFNPNRTSGASWIKNLKQQSQYVVDANNEYYRARLRVIAGLDDMVGTLVAALADHGLLNNTYIVYTTDNWYHIGQHRLGPGKKCGYETDINIPMVIRGPGIPRNQSTNVVTTHTDLASTFFKMFKLGAKGGLDGKAMPLIKAAIDSRSKSAFEHVNVEMWASGTEGENPLLKQDDSVDSGESEITRSSVPGIRNNTYKSMRVIGFRYSLYYSVWCINEHELYYMIEDPWQMDNLLSNLSDASGMGNLKGSLLGRPLSKVFPRLDALQMVLKSCRGKSCTDPWLSLHPQGNVQSLRDALNPRYDDFYGSQLRVSFSECKPGYLLEVEGPQTVRPYPD